MSTFGIWCGVWMNICFTLSFAPQILKTLRSRHVKGVAVGVYWLSLAGYLLGTLYTCLEIGWDIPLLVNFGFGLLLCIAMIALYYRHH